MGVKNLGVKSSFLNNMTENAWHIWQIRNFHKTRLTWILPKLNTKCAKSHVLLNILEQIYKSLPLKSLAGSGREISAVSFSFKKKY